MENESAASTGLLSSRKPPDGFKSDHRMAAWDLLCAIQRGVAGRDSSANSAAFWPSESVCR